MEKVENKSYKACLNIARRKIAECNDGKKEATLKSFIKVSKRHVLRNGDEYATTHSNNLYNIISGMEV